MRFTLSDLLRPFNPAFQPRLDHLGVLHVQQRVTPTPLFQLDIEMSALMIGEEVTKMKTRQRGHNAGSYLVCNLLHIHSQGEAGPGCPGFHRPICGDYAPFKPSIKNEINWM